MMSLKRQIQLLVVLIFLAPLILYSISFGIEFTSEDAKDPMLPLTEKLGEIWLRSGTITQANVLQSIRETNMSWIELIVSSHEGQIMAEYPVSEPSGRQIPLNLNQILNDQATDRQEFHLMHLSSAENSPLLLINLEMFHRRTSEVWRTLSKIGLTLSSILLLSSLMAFFVIRTLNRNIRKLVNDTSLVANGDLNHPVQAEGSTEFHVLADSIDRMRLSLKGAIHRQSLLFMGMSHDLKTPITLIQGYADALIDEIYSTQPDRTKALTIIRNKSQQLQELIDEFIYFVRTQTGSKVEKLKLDNPIPLIISICQRFQDDANLVHKQFLWNISEALRSEFGSTTIQLAYDKTLTERVIENLLGNALRYSPPGAAISLELKYENGAIIVIIRDSGPGIPAEDLPYVFDPFFRGSKSREDGGHGLGLAIVKAIVDLHGWSISLGPRDDNRIGLEARLVMSPIS